MVHLELERGLSAHTLAGYEKDLLQCAAFLQSRGGTGWARVEGNEIRSWLNELSGAGLAPSKAKPANLAPCALSVSFWCSERIRPSDFTELIDPPKAAATASGNTFARRSRPPPFGAGGGFPTAGLRATGAFLELFYSSGLRVSELCALPLQAVDLEEGFSPSDRWQTQQGSPGPCRGQGHYGYT